MMTLLDTSDIRSSSGRRHGVTALTPAEWAARDAQPHGQFVLLEEPVHSPGVVLSSHAPVASREEAYRELLRLVGLTPSAFDPEHGPIRIVIVEVKA